MLEALATTGGRPSATRTGKLSSEATPTVEVRIPAPSPAASTASCSRKVIRQGRSRSRATSLTIITCSCMAWYAAVGSPAMIASAIFW